MEIIIDIPGGYNDASGNRQELGAGDTLDTKAWYAERLKERGLAHFPSDEGAIGSLDIDSRAADSLREAGLVTQAAINGATDEELLDLAWIGSSTLLDIRNSIAGG